MSDQVRRTTLAQCGPNEFTRTTFAFCDSPLWPTVGQMNVLDPFLSFTVGQIKTIKQCKLEIFVDNFCTSSVY